MPFIDIHRTATSRDYHRVEWPGDFPTHWSAQPKLRIAMGGIAVGVMETGNNSTTAADELALALATARQMGHPTACPPPCPCASSPVPHEQSGRYLTQLRKSFRTRQERYIACYR